MAKKFDGNILFKRMEEEKAAREEREAKAKIDWRKKFKTYALANIERRGFT